MRSGTQMLADELLGIPAVVWLQSRVDNGATLRRAAADLTKQTNGKVRVSHVTVANWLAAAKAEAARKPA